MDNGGFVWKKDPRTYFSIIVLLMVVIVVGPAKDPATKDMYRHEGAYRAWKKNPTTKSMLEVGKAVDMADCQRINVWFHCAISTECHGWLYVPNAAKQEPRHAVPIVLLGHGFGAQKDIGLEQFALAFVRRGIAAFSFDYRGFGASGGNPRHVISPSMHLDDWLTAIDFVASQKPTNGSGSFELVDTSRLALWGTSLAGGHVIMAASQRPDQVAAVVSQIPLLSGKEAARRSMRERGFWGTLRLFIVVASDYMRKWLATPPLRIPIVGLKGELAMLQLEAQEIDNYFSRKPNDSVILGAWRNWAPARGAVSISDYNPIERVHEVDAPILFLSATRDTLCPHETIVEGFEKAKKGDAGERAKLVTADATHFEAYVRETGLLFADEAAEFLAEHLRPHLAHRLHPRPQPFVPDEL